MIERKKRVHFHAFMLDVQKRIHQWRKSGEQWRGVGEREIKRREREEREKRERRERREREEREKRERRERRKREERTFGGYFG